MKYNKKYDRWFTKDGLVFRYNKSKDRLIICKVTTTPYGYIRFSIFRNKQTLNYSLHRAIWETFNGEIPEGMEIDHINTVRSDNSLKNLRIVTHVENMHNPLTTINLQKATIGKNIKHREFYDKFIAHYGFHSVNNKLYAVELTYWKQHNKVCRWEAKCK